MLFWTLLVVFLGAGIYLVYLTITGVFLMRRLKREQDADLLLTAKMEGWPERDPDDILERMEKESSDARAQQEEG